MRFSKLVLASLLVIGCSDVMDETCLDQMVSFHHFNQLEALEMCGYEAKAIRYNQLKAAFNQGMSQGFTDY